MPIQWHTSIVPTFSDTMLFGHCIFYVRCRQRLETGKVSLHSLVTKSKRRKIIWCICIFSYCFLVVQNSVKQLIFWKVSQFCRSLVHSLLSWIFIWFSEECALERDCGKHSSENHIKIQLSSSGPKKYYGEISSQGLCDNRLITVATWDCTLNINSVCVSDFRGSKLTGFIF